MKIVQKKYDNLLLISGTGRKTGKTSFACRLIRELAGQHFTAVKISCHFHLQQGLPPLMEEPGNFQIFKEVNSSGQKDSSRMLAAGAKEVYYIQATREFAFQAFLKIYLLIPENTPVLCESGGLGSHLWPGLHVVMQRLVALPGDKIISYQPDVFLEMNGEGFSISPQNFFFDGEKWKLVQSFINN